MGLINKNNIDSSIFLSLKRILKPSYKDLEKEGNLIITREYQYSEREIQDCIYFITRESSNKYMMTQWNYYDNSSFSFDIQEYDDSLTLSGISNQCYDINYIFSTNLKHNDLNSDDKIKSIFDTILLKGGLNYLFNLGNIQNQLQFVKAEKPVK